MNITKHSYIKVKGGGGGGGGEIEMGGLFSWASKLLLLSNPSAIGILKVLRNDPGVSRVQGKDFIVNMFGGEFAQCKS